MYLVSFCKEIKPENPDPFSQTVKWFYLKHSNTCFSMKSKSYISKMCMEEETWVCFTDLEESLEDFEGTNKQMAFSFISIPVL